MFRANAWPSTIMLTGKVSRTCQSGSVARNKKTQQNRERKKMPKRKTEAKSSNLKEKWGRKNESESPQRLVWLTTVLLCLKCTIVYVQKYSCVGLSPKEKTEQKKGTNSGTRVRLKPKQSHRKTAEHRLDRKITEEYYYFLKVGTVQMF